MASRGIRLVLAAITASATTIFNGGPLVVLESISAPPPRFVSSSPADSDSMLDLRIALTQNNIAGLQQVLQDVSTPGNAQYGQWLSRDEVASYVRPTSDSFSLVTQWLASNDLTASNMSYAGDWLQVAVPVSKASAMLGADFNVYSDSESGMQAIRTLSYSVPSALEGHILLIHPTVNFPVDGSLPPKQVKSTDPRSPSLPASCQNDTTPLCLQDLYGIPRTPVENPDKLSLFVAEYEDQFMDFTDLQEFLSMYRPDLNPRTKFSVVSVDNGTNSQNPEAAGVEACLDFDYTVGLASGAHVTLLTVGPTNATTIAQFLDSVLDSALFIAGSESPPTVITTSYGTSENEVTVPLATAICNAYLQAGIRGTSVIYASGDDGVAGNHGANCSTGPFVPVFPATCPYLTSVGGTQLGLGNATQVAVNFTEQGWSASGGFSAIFNRGFYQEAAVAPYVAKLGDLYEGRFNKTGRGFPDVSALAVDFSIVCQGLTGEVGGTSAASPTFASIVTLLNDARFSVGKPSLGFLNPLIYSLGNEAFTDILEGDNPGCNTTGFFASTGWDPVSGFGTPIFEKLKAAVLLL